MHKKILLILLLLSISTTSLFSGNKKIHLEGFVPDSNQIIIDYENNNKITLSNNFAYYLFTNELGEKTNINNGYYINVFMI